MPLDIKVMFMVQVYFSYFCLWNIIYDLSIGDFLHMVDVVSVG